MKIDDKKIQLSEKDLENWLWENVDELQSFDIEYWLSRQYKVPSGIIDLLGVTGEGNIVIVELKNHVPDASALTQVSRYAKDIERILHARGMFTVSIYKIVMGVFDNIPSQLQFEANALDVFIQSMHIEFEIKINGVWAWTEDHSDKLSEEYQRLAKDVIFDEVFMIEQEYIKGTYNEEVKDEQA